MNFFDRFKGVRGADADRKNLYSVTNKYRPQDYDFYEPLNKEEVEKPNLKDKASAYRVAERAEILKIEKRAALEKAQMLQREKLRGQIELDKYKSQAARAKEYGPGTFYIGGKEIPVLGQISQARNWQQKQEIERLKRERAIQFERLQQEKLRREAESLRGERTAYTMGSSQTSFPQSSGGWGMGLDINRGLSMGMGLGGGMNSSNYSSGYGQQQMQQNSPSYNPMSLQLPVIGGLGGNPFGRREEQQVQQTYQQQVRQEYDTQVQQAYQQPQRVQQIPQTRIRQNRVPYKRLEPGVREEGVYRKVMESYGPRFVRVAPEEMIPGEKYFYRERVRYANSYANIYKVIK